MLSEWTSDYIYPRKQLTSIPWGKKKNQALPLNQTLPTLSHKVIRGIPFNVVSDWWGNWGSGRPGSWKAEEPGTEPMPPDSQRLLLSLHAQSCLHQHHWEHVGIVYFQPIKKENCIILGSIVLHTMWISLFLSTLKVTPGVFCQLKVLDPCSTGNCLYRKKYYIYIIYITFFSS